MRSGAVFVRAELKSVERRMPHLVTARVRAVTGSTLAADLAVNNIGGEPRDFRRGSPPFRSPISAGASVVSSLSFAAARQPCRCRVARGDGYSLVGASGSEALAGRIVRLVALALVVASGSCGTAQEPKLTDRPTNTPRRSSSVVAAEVPLLAKELFGPVAGEGALWLRDLDTGSIFRVDPEKNELAATIDVMRLWYTLRQRVGEGAR
jgi:hypothetical protein